MHELSPELQKLVVEYLSSIQDSLHTRGHPEDGDEALAACLGEFCRDYLDCSTDTDGSVIVQVPLEAVPPKGTVN